MLSYLLRLWACWPARPIPRHWLKVRKFYMTPKANPEYRLYASQLLSRGLNIEPLTLRCHLADGRTRLRVDADRYSFIVSDLHRLLLAGLSGALRKILYVVTDCPPWWSSCRSVERQVRCHRSPRTTRSTVRQGRERKDTPKYIHACLWLLHIQGIIAFAVQVDASILFHGRISEGEAENGFLETHVFVISNRYPLV
jgi:hypothetical protein